MIGVDPVGSVIGNVEKGNEHEEGFFEVEGIGYHFVPATLDFGVVDRWVKVGDADTFQ